MNIGKIIVEFFDFPVVCIVPLHHLAIAYVTPNPGFPIYKYYFQNIREQEDFDIPNSHSHAHFVWKRKSPITYIFWNCANKQNMDLTENWHDFCFYIKKQKF